MTPALLAWWPWCQQVLQEIVLLHNMPVPMNQFLAAPGIGREVPSQHQGGLSGYRSVKTGQVKLPFRDVGMNELSCPSSAGLELKSV